MKVEDSFYADGGEQFMTIGNYDDDEHIDTFFVGGLTGGIIFKEHSYYYIDDVSVTLDTTTGIAEIEKPNLKSSPTLPATKLLLSSWG
jgi:capsule polysaccharide export protein KpsE/RkpR